MSLILCLIIMSLSLASRVRKRVKQRVYHKVQKREFTESIGSESVNHMSLISCHSSHVSSLRHSSHVTHLMSQSHVTHLMSRSHVTHHMSLISCFITMSLISCLVTTSLISCLIITSLILNYCLYTLGWPHLTSAHDLCPLVTAYYCWGPLPTLSAVTFAHLPASFYREE